MGSTEQSDTGRDYDHQAQMIVAVGLPFITAVFAVIVVGQMGLGLLAGVVAVGVVGLVTAVVTVRVNDYDRAPLQYKVAPFVMAAAGVMLHLSS